MRPGPPNSSLRQVRPVRRRYNYSGGAISLRSAPNLCTTLPLDRSEFVKVEEGKYSIAELVDWFRKKC